MSLSQALNQFAQNLGRYRRGISAECRQYHHHRYNDVPAGVLGLGLVLFTSLMTHSYPPLYDSSYRQQSLHPIKKRLGSCTQHESNRSVTRRLTITARKWSHRR